MHSPKWAPSNDTEITTHAKTDNNPSFYISITFFLSSIECTVTRFLCSFKIFI